MLGFVARFLADTDRWLVERAFPLRQLPRQINAYRSQAAPPEAQGRGVAFEPQPPIERGKIHERWDDNE
jgi:hypothetical protein